MNYFFYGFCFCLRNSTLADDESGTFTYIYLCAFNRLSYTYIFEVYFYIISGLIFSIHSFIPFIYSFRQTASQPFIYSFIESLHFSSVSVIYEAVWMHNKYHIAKWNGFQRKRINFHLFKYLFMMSYTQRSIWFQLWVLMYL